jgi:hypothetical protein
MTPWFWTWAPQIHLPLSGDVAQRIDPKTVWRFDAIPGWAGDGRLEQRAVNEVASYGRQLGLITEVLLSIARQLPPGDAAARESLARLERIAAEIEGLKPAPGSPRSP